MMSDACRGLLQIDRALVCCFDHRIDANCADVPPCGEGLNKEATFVAKRRRRRQRRSSVLILGFVGAIAAGWWLLYVRSPRAVAPSGDIAIGERVASSPAKSKFVPLAAPRLRAYHRDDASTRSR